MVATYAQRKALGDYGERLAANELVGRGLTVLDLNWRCREGEIDIVAKDGRTLVVCEVKTRSSNRFGSAVQAITPEKAARLHRLGRAWLVAHELGFDHLRVDVVTVLLARRSGPAVTYYEGLA